MLRQSQSRALIAAFPTLEARIAAIRRAAAISTTGCAECGGEDDAASNAASNEYHKHFLT